MKPSITVPCETKNLAYIREFLENQMESWAIHDEVFTNQLILAVDEACSNSIIHGNKNDPSHTLTIEAWKDSDNIHIDLYDHHSPAFDLKSHKADEICVKFERRDCGGLGVLLIQRIMDQIDIMNNSECCVYKFTKKISY